MGERGRARARVPALQSKRGSFMIVIPAIDLRGGRCVRLVQGKPEAETVFSDDPVAMARHWAGLGAERLHVVDLDGAFSGAPKQTALIREIVEAVSIPVEAGGGLRDLDNVEELLDSGAEWALLGSRAALDGDFLEEACRRFPKRIIVAVDAVGGKVAVEGWKRLSARRVEDLALEAHRAGAAALLYTDILKDGTGSGPNVETTRALAAEARIPIIASGGIGSVEDLKRLARVPGLIGAVVGRALYTGAVDLKAARRLLKRESRGVE
jgi:phosphoribosylformimino-5-aminoimidazole carboxamide ribotide isomerase